MEIMPHRAVDIRLGQLVTSRAGRDAGADFLVLSREGEHFVLVADGMRRRVDKAKRKNVLHLVAHSCVAEELEARLQVGERVGDQDIRRAMGSLQDRKGGGARGGQG